MSRKKRLEKNSKRSMTRREFSSRVAFAAATAVVVPAHALGRSPEPISSAGATRQSSDTAAASPVAEARYQALLSQYGDRLTGEQKADAKRLLIQAEKTGQAMAKFQLGNADEPAPLFRVYSTEAE